MEPEGFLGLVRDLNHWGFELLANLVIDGLLFALVWPWIKRVIFSHVHKDIEKVSGKRPHNGEVAMDCPSCRGSGTTLGPIGHCPHCKGTGKSYSET